MRVVHACEFTHNQVGDRFGDELADALRAALRSQNQVVVDFEHVTRLSPRFAWDAFGQLSEDQLRRLVIANVLPSEAALIRIAVAKGRSERRSGARLGFAATG